VTLTPGLIIVRGNTSSRKKKKSKFVDYVLYWEPGLPIAVVEAKDNNHTVSHGMQQALGDAEMLNVPSAFASNGDAFAAPPMQYNNRIIGKQVNYFPTPALVVDRHNLYVILEVPEYL
jgi:type I site-specific restriction endonuclease